MTFILFSNWINTWPRTRCSTNRNKIAKNLDQLKSDLNDSTANPKIRRPIEVCLNSLFDKRLVLSKMSKLKRTAVINFGWVATDLTIRDLFMYASQT